MRVRTDIIIRQMNYHHVVWSIATRAAASTTGMTARFLFLAYQQSIVLTIREIGPPLPPPFFSLTAADASARFLPAQTRSFPMHEKLAESALRGGRIYHITFPASRERRSVRGWSLRPSSMARREVSRPRIALLEDALILLKWYARD